MKLLTPAPTENVLPWSTCGILAMAATPATPAITLRSWAVVHRIVSGSAIRHAMYLDWRTGCSVGEIGSVAVQDKL
jgi:hypothetical protein